MTPTLAKSSRWTRPDTNWKANVAPAVIHILSFYVEDQAPANKSFGQVDIAKAGVMANWPTKKTSALKQEFNALAKSWRDETAHSSLLRDRITHPAYLEIIGLGKKVIPLIIERLDKKENYWFPALRAIARHNPIPNGSSFPDAVKLWKQWWKEETTIRGMDFRVD